MCLTARDGRFLQVNAALTQMLGYSEQELLDGAWQNLTYPADMQRSKQALQHFMLGEAGRWSLRSAMSTKTGIRYGSG